MYGYLLVENRLTGLPLLQLRGPPSVPPLTRMQVCGSLSSPPLTRIRRVFGSVRKADTASGKHLLWAAGEGGARGHRLRRIENGPTPPHTRPNHQRCPSHLQELIHILSFGLKDLGGLMHRH